MTKKTAIIAIAEELAGGGDNLWEYPNNDRDRECYKAQATKLLAVATPHLAISVVPVADRHANRALARTN